MKTYMTKVMLDFDSDWSSDFLSYMESLGTVGFDMRDVIREAVKLAAIYRPTLDLNIVADEINDDFVTSVWEDICQACIESGTPITPEWGETIKRAWTQCVGEVYAYISLKTDVPFFLDQFGVVDQFTRIACDVDVNNLTWVGDVVYFELCVWVDEEYYQMPQDINSTNMPLISSI